MMCSHPLRPAVLMRVRRGLSLLLFSAVPWPLLAQTLQQDLDPGWQFRQAPAAQASPGPAAIHDWQAATVPGSVQTDLLHLGEIPDPFYRDNEARVQWVGLTDWDYRRRFQLDPGLQQARHIALVLEGVDTFAEVELNGHRLLRSDNMFKSWRLELGPWLHRQGENTLLIHFHSPIRRLQPWLARQPYAMPGAYDSRFGDEPKGRDSATYVRKAQYQYGWDWGPRLVTEGLWRPVYLQAWSGVRLERLILRNLALNARQASLRAELSGQSDQAGPARLVLALRGPDGTQRRLQEQVWLPRGPFQLSVPLQIAQPQRWYPAGYGAQPIYQVQVQLQPAAGEAVAISQSTGLRTVELVRQPDRWGRSFSLRINGVPVFVKGANMVPQDSFPERVTPARQLALLQSARAAHMNMIRVWGGGYYQDDAFYRQADRLGLMIWQDFMFGGAIMPDLPALQRNAVAEARQQVARLADHPSIVLWCGNNEVQADWDSWDDTLAFRRRLGAAAAARLWQANRELFGHALRAVVQAQGLGVPYWATSPGNDLAGPSNQLDDGDYHSWTVWSKSAPISQFLQITPRFMTEFGLESMPALATLRQYLQPADLRIDSPVLLVHQKFGQGIGNQRLLYYIRAGYGQPRDFAGFVYLSQLMQAEGIELAVDHLRASRPRTMGVLYWQLNDAWPAASWSSIDYAGRWKALQYHAVRFYSPTRVAAIHSHGQVQISLIHDGLQPQPVRLEVELLDTTGGQHGQQQQRLELAPASVRALPPLNDAQWLHGLDPTRAVLAVSLLSPTGERLSRQLVYFVPARQMAWPDPGLQFSTRPGPAHQVWLQVHADKLARGVWLDFGSTALQPADNAFDLLPGETRQLLIRGSDDPGWVARHLKLISLHDALATDKGHGDD